MSRSRAHRPSARASFAGLGRAARPSAAWWGRPRRRRDRRRRMRAARSSGASATGALGLRPRSVPDAVSRWPASRRPRAAYGIELALVKGCFRRRAPRRATSHRRARRGNADRGSPYGRSRAKVSRCALGRSAGGTSKTPASKRSETLAWAKHDRERPSAACCPLDLAGSDPRSRSVSKPLTDDVPRQLEPVLRQGAVRTLAQVRV